MEIPGDWVPIPEMHMVALAEGATTRWVAAGGTPNRGFRYGFQQGPVQKWFHPPFVTFDIRRSGRVPWRALAGLPRVESGTLGGAGGLGQLEPGECAYDRDRDLVWMHVAGVGSNAPTGSLLAAVFLTQEGVIQANAYLPPPGARSDVSGVIGRVAGSVIVEASIAYRKPRLETWPLFDHLDWSQPARRHLEIAILAVLVPLVGLLGIVLWARGVTRRESSPMGRARSDEDV